MNDEFGISVIIYTKNEQQDLPGCLQSLIWCDDIHVYDSMSTDNTVELAESFGAVVTQRSYPDNTIAFGGDEAAHRNWAFGHIAFRHEWVLHLDADERVTPELVQEMLAVLKQDHGKSAFRIRRRDFFMGRWLKYVIPSPFNIRLFRKTRVRYERLINPVTLIEGDVGDLNAPFNHFPFSKGMHHWIAKHNAYSDFEALQVAWNRSEKSGFNLWQAFFEPDLNRRRAQQKELFYRLPFRPLVMFVLLYVVRRGFLDGRAGFNYAMLRAMYEYMIVIKAHDLAGQTFPE